MGKRGNFNVWALALAIVKAIGPLIRSLGKDSPGGKKVTPAEADEVVGVILTVAQEFFHEHTDHDA